MKTMRERLAGPLERIRLRLGWPRRYTARDVAHAPTLQLAQERFVWRMYQEIVLRPENRSWAILSATTPEATQEARSARSARLRQTLRSTGVGSFEFLVTPTTRPDRAVPVFLVVNPTLAQVLRWSAGFEQPLVIYCGPETRHRIDVISAQGGHTTSRRFRFTLVTGYLQELFGGDICITPRPFSVIEGMCLNATWSQQSRHEHEPFGAENCPQRAMCPGRR